MIQRRPERPGAAPRSSARIPSSGNADRSRRTINSSARASISGTRLVGAPLLGMGGGPGGGVVGAKPRGAGESVAMVARGEHLAAIRRDGLTIRSAVEGEWVV